MLRGYRSLRWNQLHPRGGARAPVSRRASGHNGAMNAKRFLIVLLALAPAWTLTPAAANAADEITPVFARVVAAPQPVRADDGRVHLAYELLLTNQSSSAAAVQRIDVLAGGRTITSLSGAALDAVTIPYDGGPHVAVLKPGLAAMVLVDVALPARADLPTKLVHRFVIAQDPVQPAAAMTYRTAPTRVVQRPAMLIAPPLRGDRWVVGNGCCATATSHRGAVLASNGGLHAPERYAIDFVQLTPQDRVFTGAIGDLSSYAFFGADVLSVAPGKVVAKVDGLPEGTPPDPPPGVTAANAGGNHLVVDMGHGRYAFYAHLQPGSMAVKVGDRVRTGQKLAGLGNTGNSTAPHLHFHIMDSPSPLGSNGLPFRFTRFSVRGTIGDILPLFDGGPATYAPPPGGVHRGELPLDNQVIDLG
jgi:murein DD-endopeptidase MepM/ murein hydrolase activator NlpD